MWVQTGIYVILKGQNGGLRLNGNRSLSDMMEPHVSLHNDINVVPICVILMEI